MEPRAVRGFIVVAAETGKVLRRRPAAVPISAVLDVSGDFRAGDRIGVVVRGSDGGQGVVAAGVASCDAASLRARNFPSDGLALRECDVQPLWPPSPG